MDFYPDIDQGWESDAAINMSNSNAYRMLNLLGLNRYEECSRIPVVEFEMAILNFLVTEAEAGRQIDPYIARRLTDLRVLCYAAGGGCIIVV